MSKGYAYRSGRASGRAETKAKPVRKAPGRSARPLDLHLVAAAPRKSARRSVAASGLIVREALDEFIQTLAHDVRNHAQAVSRNLGVLLDGACGPLDARQAEVLSASRDCIDMVVDLTGDLDDLCGQESGGLTLARARFDLVPLLAACVRRSRAAGADRGIRFVFTRGCASAMVHADRSRVGRVLSNLLMNAARFSPSGGRVTASCFRDDEEGIVVGISDLGPGIPAEIQARGFERPNRAPSRGGQPGSGHGLGLSFCKRTIGAHGGRIWIESPLPGREHGACVRFTLPLIPEERA